MMTDAAATKYAILGQRKLKHRNDIVGARRHNLRERETLNADLTKPEPIVVFGPADAWKGVKDRLAELKIKPGKTAVHAIELMMTTSPEWWLPDEDDHAIQRRAYERMAWKYLRGRFPPEAIVSLIWHLDETTPHLHVIVVPIRQRVDGRFKDGRMRWTLSARGDLSHAAKGPDGTPLIGEDGKPVIVPAGEWRGGIGGIQHMEREQTIFAEVMAPLGIVRGAERSDGVHKPNAKYQAEMRAEIAARQVAKAGYERERDLLAEQRAAHDAHVEAEKKRFAEEREAMDKEREVLDARAEKARAWDKRARERAQELDDLERQERAIAKRERKADRDLADLDERADAIADLADAARLVLENVDTSQLPAELRPRIYEVANQFGVALQEAVRRDRRVRDYARGPAHSRAL